MIPSCLSLPIFLTKNIGRVLPFAQFFWDLVSILLPTRTVVQSVLLRAFIFVTSSTLFFRLTDICPRFVCLSSQHSGLVPATLLLSTLHTRALLPTSSNRPSWLGSKASSSRPAGRPLSCPPPPAKQGVPLWPRDAQITSLAHDCSCTSSHLSPCLYFKDLFLPSLLLLSQPCSHPHTVLPKKMRGRLTSMKVRATPTLSCLLRLPSASSISTFLQARCPPLVLSTLSREPSPSSTTSPHMTSCIFLEDPIVPDDRESHITFFLLAFSFAPRCLVLVLKSKATPPFLLRS